MKINSEKINKLQEGGYLTYRPLSRPPDVVPQQEEPADNSKKAEEGTGLGVDDKSMQKLLGNGITNDVMAFSESMSAVQDQYAQLTESEREGPKGRQIRSMLRGNFADLNALIRSKDLFKQAYDRANSQGGLEEFAVVPGNFIVKKADGSIDRVGFAQFAKDKANDTVNYKPLTNAELAQEREYNKSLVGNNSIFSILEYSKGIDNVKKEILEIATGLGKTSQSSSTGAYDEGTVEAIRTAQLAAGQGMFKVKESSSQSTNSPQIQRAKEVMWSTLSDNSKNVLRARAAFLETDPAKIEQRAALLAMDLLDPRLDQSQSSASDMMATRPAKGASGSGGSGEALGDLGQREAAVNSKNQIEHMELLSDYGVQINSRMSVLPKEDITRKNKDGIIVPTTVASSELAKYGFIGQATTLNGDKINPNQTIFTGEAYYTRVPVKRTPNGLVLDEDGAKRLAAATAEFNALPESQKNGLNESRIKQKHNATALDVQDVIIAEAASYEDKYTLWGLRGKRDAKFYHDADDETTRVLGEVVDPDETGPRKYLDYKAYKHLVIIPSKGEAAARYADGNNLFAPKKGWDATNPLRGPQTSRTTFGGSSFSSPSNPAFSLDALN